MVRKEEENKDSEIIEHGDLFFFYRPKIDAEEVKELEDVGRFYMVTSPEQDDGSAKESINTSLRNIILKYWHSHKLAQTCLSKHLNLVCAALLYLYDNIS